MAAREIKRFFDHARRMIIIDVEDQFGNVSHLQIQVQLPPALEPDVSTILLDHLADIDRNAEHFVHVSRQNGADYATPKGRP